MPATLEALDTHKATVIFLHGLGDHGYNWLSIFNKYRLANVKYIFPTAPIRKITLLNGQGMNAWFDKKGLTYDSPQDHSGLIESSLALLDLIQEEINTTGISNESIFIGGFSQGGAVALYTAIIAPFRLAGVLTLSSWMPLHKYFQNEVKLIAPNRNSKHTPIFQCHGDADTVIPIEWGLLTKKLLKSLKFKKMDFKKFKGLGHAGSKDEMNEVNNFLKKILFDITIKEINMKLMTL